MVDRDTEIRMKADTLMPWLIFVCVQDPWSYSSRHIAVLISGSRAAEGQG